MSKMTFVIESDKQATSEDVEAVFVSALKDVFVAESTSESENRISNVHILDPGSEFMLDVRIAFRNEAEFKRHLSAHAKPKDLRISVAPQAVLERATITR